MSSNVPVLLILREGQSVSSAMFDGMREARPRHLSVAIVKTSAGAEEIVDPELQADLDVLVDWQCHVQIRRVQNTFGLAEPVCKAISCFLAEAGRGIIIEAGFRVSADFFDFCERGLESYANRSDVWHISGSNLGAPERLFDGGTAAFTSVADTNCWATWRDRWDLLRANPFFVAEDARKSSGSWRLSAIARANVMHQLDDLKEGSGCWESLWQATILNNSGVALCPDRALVALLPEASTRTELVELQSVRQDVEVGKDPSEPAYSSRLDRWLEKAKGIRSLSTAFQYLVSTGTQRAALTANRGMAKVFFGRASEPIIIASNGRSGSTMLCNAVADSLVRKRFGESLPRAVGHFLREVTFEFVPRLHRSGRYSTPIVKTHDWPDDDTNIHGKAIFIFGDPLESVLSAQLRAERVGYAWLQKHLFHLRSHGDMDELLDSDVLGFSNQCQAWFKAPRENVMVVAFDDLWNRQEEISRFLGFPIVLPRQRSRRPKPAAPRINQEVFDKLRAEYERMYQRSVERLDAM